MQPIRVNEFVVRGLSYNENIGILKTQHNHEIYLIWPPIHSKFVAVRIFWSYALSSHLSQILSFCIRRKKKLIFEGARWVTTTKYSYNTDRRWWRYSAEMVAVGSAMVAVWGFCGWQGEYEHVEGLSKGEDLKKREERKKTKKFNTVWT